MAIERCLCGATLNVVSPKWRCPYCKREWEYAEIIEDWTEPHIECSGLGLSHRRKWVNG